jgi:hypothetical protein
VEVRSARVLSIRGEWPAEHRWVLDLFLASPHSEGLKSNYTPRFIAASKEKNKMLHTSWGTLGWSDHTKPWLDKHVGS